MGNWEVEMTFILDASLKTKEGEFDWHHGKYLD